MDGRDECRLWIVGFPWENNCLVNLRILFFASTCCWLRQRHAQVEENDVRFDDKNNILLVTMCLFPWPKLNSKIHYSHFNGATIINYKKKKKQLTMDHWWILENIVIGEIEKETIPRVGWWRQAAALLILRSEDLATVAAAAFRECHSAFLSHPPVERPTQQRPALPAAKFTKKNSYNKDAVICHFQITILRVTKNPKQNDVDTTLWNPKNMKKHHYIEIIIYVIIVFYHCFGVGNGIAGGILGNSRRWHEAALGTVSQNYEK